MHLNEKTIEVCIQLTKEQISTAINMELGRRSMSKLQWRAV